MTPSDEELVTRAREGDEEAFEALFRRHRTRLLAQARRRLPGVLRRRVSASDVVQECALTAHRKLGDFEDRGPGSFGRWVRTILEHKLKDEIRNHLWRGKRAAGREVSREGRPATQGFEGRVGTASRHAMALERRDAVIEGIGKLPADYRTVLRLVHDAGLTVAEAADQMGRTPEATRKLYSRAVSRLAKELAPEEGA